jgi:hypothetical protein
MGGGIYFDGTALNMSGGTVGGLSAGNEAHIGAGIYVGTGTFNMSGGSISYNLAGSGDGGGVHVRGNGSFIMSGGSSKTISYNEAGNGAGIFKAGTGSLIITDGAVIGQNTASDSGGGVSLNDTPTAPNTNKMTGGQISGNSANFGGGVYAVYQFDMEGNAAVNVDNDVYLSAADSTIKVTGSLLSNPAAKITVLNYETSRQVLSGDVTGNNDKFTVTAPGWYVDGDGKLAN